MTPSSPNDQSAAADPRRRSSAMPLIGESVAPWLIAGVILAVLNLTMVIRGLELAVLEQSLLLVGLGATLAAAGLVSARSNRVLEAGLRAERSRPAADELVGLAAEARTASYVRGMERWTAAMLDLIDHAMSVTEPGTAVHEELATVASETRDLRELLAVEAPEDLTINDHAKLHALGSLWETGQLRAEQLAADADAAWHRRWRARTVVERLLRHGHDLPRPLVLPYR